MEDYKNAKSVYDFTVKDSQGADVSLEKYRGKVLLIVNIASQCGLTKGNYAELTELSQKYADKGRWSRGTLASRTFLNGGEGSNCDAMFIHCV